MVESSSLSNTRLLLRFISQAQALCPDKAAQSLASCDEDDRRLDPVTCDALERLARTVEAYESSGEMNREELGSTCEVLMQFLRRNGPVEEVVEIVMAMRRYFPVWEHDPVLDNEWFWMEVGPLLMRDCERYRPIAPGLYDDMAFNFARQHIIALYRECEDIDAVIDWLKAQPLLGTEDGYYSLATAVIQFIDMSERFEDFNPTDDDLAKLTSAFPENGPIQRKMERMRAKN